MAGYKRRTLLAGAAMVGEQLVHAKTRTSISRMRHSIKRLLSFILSAAYRATAVLGRSFQRVRSHALLSSYLKTELCASVVVLGAPEVHGSGKIRIGPNALLFPSLYLETQGDGTIEIGERVVISRGVHISSRAGIIIGSGTMIGEYSSIRDANHVRSEEVPIRESGFDARPITIGEGVWIGRGVAVLGGVTIGDGAIVGANAVVVDDVPPRSTAVGVPTRLVGSKKEQ